MTLPARLMPEAWGVETAYGEPKARPIRIEESVLRQIERINWLRTTGEDWEEALQVLRDLVVGLEDKRFMEDWEDRSLRAVETESGPVYMPTWADLSASFQILMRLLARRNITYSVPEESKTGPVRWDEEE